MNGSYGLGFSIAESHKERIWAESENGYNTFLFTCQQITESKSGGIIVSPSLCCPYKLGQFTLTGGPEFFMLEMGPERPLGNMPVAGFQAVEESLRMQNKHQFCQEMKRPLIISQWPLFIGKSNYPFVRVKP